MNNSASGSNFQWEQIKQNLSRFYVATENNSKRKMTTKRLSLAWEERSLLLFIEEGFLLVVGSKVFELTCVTCGSDLIGRIGGIVGS